MVSRIDDFCPKCGKPAYEALYVPIGDDNHVYACRNCDTTWGAVDNWAALEEYAHTTRSHDGGVPDEDSWPQSR